MTPALQEPPAAADHPIVSRTVLCVEDNPSNLRLVERVLARRPGISMLGADTGGLGLTLAAEHRPAAVLLDLDLPDLPGAEVLRRLRRHPDTASIPVVVLSADATDTQIETLLAAGAQAYLTKPLDIRELLSVIEAAVCDVRAA